MVLTLMHTLFLPVCLSAGCRSAHPVETSLPTRSKDEARRLLAIFIPDVKSHKLSNFEASGPLNCELTASAVLNQLREVWFLAHLVGW